MKSQVVEMFEREFARKLGIPEAVAVNNGTAALIACLWSLDLEPGDEVITTPYTFMATANAILISGGTPIFADVDPERLLLDPEQIARKVTPRTRAVIPVHLFGRVCLMEEILALAEYHGLVVLEDTAQALGALGSGGALAGTLGDAGTFSFYRTKNLSTFEGGMIALPARTRLNAHAVRAIVSQGDAGGRDYRWVGFNFRLAEPLALLGLHALTTHWPGVMAELGRYGPGDGYYPHVVYDTPAYRRLGIKGDCPVAEEAAGRVRQLLEERGQA